MNKLPELISIPVYRPTADDFKNFSEYVGKAEKLNGRKFGAIKIIPPEGWNPRKSGYENLNISIPRPIKQVFEGKNGIYETTIHKQKSLQVREFRKLTQNKLYMTPPNFGYKDLENKYWQELPSSSPIYGADVSGSLYDNNVSEFNLNKLKTILDVLKNNGITFEGVNTPYLYFGMWKTTFPWHTEDMDLYSINYLHYGAPKTWYIIPQNYGTRFEELASDFFDDSQYCRAFMRHKMAVISPDIIQKKDIQIYKTTQEAGEFIITFPYAYHSGFNHGYNVAEAINFALKPWIGFGEKASECTCSTQVKIDMSLFTRTFPKKIKNWKVHNIKKYRILNTNTYSYKMKIKRVHRKTKKTWSCQMVGNRLKIKIRQ